MLKLEIGMYNKRGFTLIEILIVLLIIGITVGFAVVAFGDFGAKRRIVFATEQFVNDVKLAQHQAILETGTFGILVNKNTYQIFRFNGAMNWEKVSESSIFRKHTFPDQSSLYFKPQIKTQGNPQIVINESGDMNAFHLFVELKGVVVATVIGHHSGLLQLDTKSSS